MEDLNVPECTVCQNKCCAITTYKLTNADIERIESLGFKRKHFAFGTEYGQIQLMQPCPFYDPTRTKFCTIYEHRPFGCRVYPIIIIRETGICQTHEFCHAWQRISKEEIRQYCPRIKDYLKTIIEEGKGRMELRDTQVRQWKDLWNQKDGLKI